MTEGWPAELHIDNTFYAVRHSFLVLIEKYWLEILL